MQHVTIRLTFFRDQASGKLAGTTTRDRKFLVDLADLNELDQATCLTQSLQRGHYVAGVYSYINSHPNTIENTERRLPMFHCGTVRPHFLENRQTMDGWLLSSRFSTDPCPEKFC